MTATQVLILNVGNHEYAIDILSVIEVRRWQKATRIPNTDERILGVLPVRGMLIPVVDLRELFHCEDCSFEATNVIVLISAIVEGETKNLGAVVDSVSDVVDIEAKVLPIANEIESADATFLTGLLPIDDRLVMLLDTDKLVSVQNNQASVSAETEAKEPQDARP
ncbi:MAG: chemotaxis protein CheW [Deltaproteobacteria bacterium]|nr:chemotaxis protein CheW [Deltaproteobacteria bacterium]